MMGENERLDISFILSKGTGLRKSAERMGQGRSRTRDPVLKPETGRVKARKGRRWSKFSEPDTV